MSTWLKKLVIGSPLESSARRFYTLLKGDRVDLAAVKNVAYDQQTFEVMQRWLKEDSNCVDVGCSKGEILKQMLRCAPQGTHYAFEPIPAFFQSLTMTFSNVKVCDVALSDFVGDVAFQYVLNSPGYSGLKRRSYDTTNTEVQEITVKTDLLDNIIPESQPISFIKIDVEGAELQVLRGATRTIRKNQPVIIFEHGLGAADFYGTTPEEVYDLLTGECGLQISLMEDWLGSAGPLNREGFTTQFYQGLNFYFMAHP